MAAEAAGAVGSGRPRRRPPRRPQRRRRRRRPRKRQRRRPRRPPNRAPQRRLLSHPRRRRQPRRRHRSPMFPNNRPRNRSPRSPPPRRPEGSASNREPADVAAPGRGRLAGGVGHVGVARGQRLQPIHCPSRACRERPTSRPPTTPGGPADSSPASQPRRRSRATKKVAERVIRLATWNINSLKVRMPRVEQWLAEVEPDIVCLQETKVADAAFPALTFASIGYESAHHGQGQWNGVAVAFEGRSRRRRGRTSRSGIDPDVDARIITATCGGIRVSSVYVPNGRSLDHEHYLYKLDWLGRLGRTSTSGSATDGAAVVAGDFNIAPDDRDVYDPAKFVGATHVSEPERARSARARRPRPGRRVPAPTTTVAACTRGGTTAPATSTKGAACGST